MKLMNFPNFQRNWPSVPLTFEIGKSINIVRILEMVMRWDEGPPRAEK